MTKRCIILIVTIIFSTSSNVKSQEIGWKVPFLPIEITYDFNSGFGIKGTSSLVTPIGEFSISSSTYNVSSATGGRNYNDSNRVRTSSGRASSYNSTTKVKYVDKVQYVKVPVYKEVIREVIVKEKEYLLILRNRNTGKDLAFLIKGVADFEAILKGETRISASEGQIIIDITDTDYQRMLFKGRKVDNPSSFTDRVYSLCQKFSDYGNGSEGGVSFYDKENISKTQFYNISSAYKVRNNKYETISIIELSEWRYDYDCRYCKGQLREKLSYTDHIILAENGIYWSPLEIQKKRLRKEFDSYYNFATWKEFANMTIKRVDDCMLSIENYNGFHGRVGYIRSNDHLSAHEWELFFESLRELVLKYNR